MNKLVKNMTKKQKKDLKLILISAVWYAAALIICHLMDFQSIAGKWGGLAVELVMFMISYVFICRNV